MRYHHANLLLVAAGLCLVSGGVLVGCSSWSWSGFFDHFNPLSTPTTPEQLKQDPTGLVSIFGHLAGVLIGLGVLAVLLGCLASFNLKVITGGAIAIGIGAACGAARGMVAEHPVWLYSALGVCIAAVVYLNIHGGTKAVSKFTKGKRYAKLDLVSRTGGGGVLSVPPPGAGGDAPTRISREWTDGPRAEG